MLAWLVIGLCSDTFPSAKIKYVTEWGVVEISAPQQDLVLATQEQLERDINSGEYDSMLDIPHLGDIMDDLPVNQELEDIHESSDSEDDIAYEDDEETIRLRKLVEE